MLPVLRNAAEFKSVYERGAKRLSRSFVVFALPNGLTECRFGLTTPRKLGKAHDRNRIKRQSAGKWCEVRVIVYQQASIG